MRQRKGNRSAVDIASFFVLPARTKTRKRATETNACLPKIVDMILLQMQPRQKSKGKREHNEHPASPQEKADGTRLEASYGRFSLLFVKNGGQLAPEVDFTVHGSDKTLYFTPESLIFSLVAPSEPEGTNHGAPQLPSHLVGREKPREEAPREVLPMKPCSPFSRCSYDRFRQQSMGNIQVICECRSSSKRSNFLILLLNERIRRDDYQKHAPKKRRP